jgi:protocatechuate 3,4-dioxygenase beta subunit
MITRRQTLLGATASCLATPALALRPTPQQTPGPFFPDILPRESDFDLVTMAGNAPATGEVITVEGRVLGPDGRPVPQAAVELWQANAWGRYSHSRDRSDAPLDPNFQGYGIVRADAEGRYRFRTISPGAYAGRTRHLHFYVAGPGFERVPLQMYFAGDAGNANDFLYRSLPTQGARDAVTADFATGTGRFDIILG